VACEESLGVNCIYREIKKQQVSNTENAEGRKSSPSQVRADALSNICPGEKVVVYRQVLGSLDRARVTKKSILYRGRTNPGSSPCGGNHTKETKNTKTITSLRVTYLVSAPSRRGGHEIQGEKEGLIMAEGANLRL